MADKIVIDCTTGDETTSPLTAAEQSERDQLEAEAVQERQQREADETDAESERQFTRQRVGVVLDKARAIMADPQGAADFTATERKVILAALLLDLVRRHR